MVARQLGVLEGGWLHTGAMAVTIGCGLAMAELGWLRRLARLGAGAHGGTLRVVSLSYLVGCLVATCIFAAADIVELSFAPVIILVSAPLAVRLRALDGARPQGGEPACEAAGAAGAARAAGGSVFAKAIVYLVVVSFVFGALSQASAVMPHPGLFRQGARARRYRAGVGRHVRGLAAPVRACPGRRPLLGALPGRGLRACSAAVH